MAKKLKALTKSDDKQLAEAVRNSAQQIWHAGLGAFAKAQAEGGKMFAKLIKEGTDLQKRTQRLAEDKVSGVTGTVTKMADNVSKQATGSMDKLEQIFEDRVSRSLARLGVPTKKDIQTLTKRVEQLNKAVAALSGKKSSSLNSVKAASTKTNTKTTAKKTAKKTAAPTKAASAKITKILKTTKPSIKKTAPKLVAVKKLAVKKPILLPTQATHASQAIEAIGQ